MGDQLMDHAMKITPLLIAAGVFVAAPAFAQANTDPARDPAKTEVWTPVPATVATPPGKAPSDAIVLFDGKDASAWEAEQGGRVPWTVADGALTVVPGSKGIRTKQRFCDIQLHVEWRTPVATKGFDGQNRGNSGIFLQERYELQVLDSYNNPTYANGVLVQDDTVLAGRTEYIGAPSYSPHACAPLYLQEHDSKVSYRNIWVREL